VAEREGCLLVKLQHATVGLPDRLLLRPSGTVAFVEFKRGREQPTKIQAYWHERLRRMGFEVAVVRSLYAFRKVLTLATDPV
jgi:hypothetical protein